jgi:hypothetical protein
MDKPTSTTYNPKPPQGLTLTLAPNAESAYMVSFVLANGSMYYNSSGEKIALN